MSKSQIISGVFLLIFTLILPPVLVIGNFANEIDNSTNYDSPNIQSENPIDKEDKKWVEIYSIKGTGVKKSPIFSLNGNTSRIKYKYSSQDNIGVGMFAVYIVDEGKEILKHGGIPEVMVTTEFEESESAIHKAKGNYYLDINADGKWEITIEEYR